jgi:hypothetical protein
VTAGGRVRTLGRCVDFQPPVHPSTGRRLPGSGSRPEVITVAVRWYLRYSLSYRDLD